MAQLPVSMRRKRAAITSIHDKPPTRKEKLTNFGGWLLLCIAVLVLAFGILGLYKVMTNSDVAELGVIGTRSAAEQRQVMQYVSPIVTENYFTSDLEAIRDRTLELSWVDRVVVSRAWPNGIRVRVMPHHAIARWGTGRLLSDSGVIFTEVTPKNYQALPLLHGPASHAETMMRRYNEINQLFLPQGIRLKELYLTERMTWFMQFDSGLRIIVDKDQTMSKLQRLSHLSQSDLKPVWSKISAIDLRYRNGLSIQWKNSIPPKIVNGHFIVTIDDTGVENKVTVKP
ncbi:MULTISPECIES: cell division protein FtsQ/DivIB [Acinetobacter]|jgi:cell division protein FtsQ|uniref:cell division protein FtsQ/DivIB n=1 Tax=Acinetobacter TaxID=469 RepID=UPI0009001F10|nr:MULTISPECIES: cell division protein FtsQ/DivIB [Acinetobacter]MCJ0927324.1 cell division protein FtsQ/DivIB [Acinetobacter lwoffii]MCO8097360.1 cell division protein FtsQ/DivIB [Acinetobacter lwoffii]OIU86893.1 cell division protein FtsQ [Acinetobacter sp. AR2-3]UBX52325.1 cell division protein FtsQ/DivIB [Acinetobacter pseudolwoffii]UHT66257.1 Cell division protein FtsQ [Acinetobacter lwoffii]